jgi:hypothetical protein
MNNRLRGERLQIMLSPEELSALDDFRFKNRMPSRASAIREILRRGLGVAVEASAKAGSKSSDFGVLATRANTRRGAARA